MAIIKNSTIILKSDVKVTDPKVNNGFLRYDSANDQYETILPDNILDSTSTNIVQNQAVVLGIANAIAEGIPYLTTAPTSDNTNGKIILVVLPESQKATTIQYEGYWYVFVQDPPTP